MTSLEHLRAFAKPLGVRILLENIPNELSTPDQLVEMIRSAHFGDVGVCLRFRPCPHHGFGERGFRDSSRPDFVNPRPRQREG